MFKKAVKEKLNGRIALDGPSGGGKTMTALRIGMSMLPPGGRMAVIDTERGSARKYVGEFGIDFDVIELETFEPQTYVKAINEAAKAKFPVLVIDSMSHAWSGSGGLLEQVDDFAKRSQSGNTFAAWKQGTPIQTQFIEAILSYPGHVIVTMRSKTEWVIETNAKGKSVPRKIGMAAIQRDGMEYEFDIFADINADHEMVITKTRCPLFVDKIIDRAGEDFGRVYLGWLNSGVSRPVEAAAPVAPVAPTAPAPVTAAPVATVPAAPKPSIRDKYEAALSKCDTLEKYQAIEARFAKIDVSAKTSFDATETWRIMLDRHRDRIAAVNPISAAKLSIDFVVRVDRCEDAAVLEALKKELEASAVLKDSQACLDALVDKERQFNGDAGMDELEEPI